MRITLLLLNSFFLFVFFNMNVNAQITKQWVANYNGDGDFNDRFVASTKDSTGNILVAGSTSNPEVNRDILVVKFNSSGTKLWQYVYDGPGSGADEATAIATDASGNVFISGFSKGLNTSTDYIVIKLNNNGVLQWMQFYDSDFDYDQANDIAIDALGNVYVTGQSDGDGTSSINDDYATIKYSSTGSQVWVKRFNGVGNLNDRAVKIGIDASNDIYVTGRSNSGVDDDYVTIKYNSSGTVVWSKYDDRGGNDRPSDLVVKGSNIYITGKSDNGNNYDFWTIKYNAAGTQLWNKVYDFIDDDNAVALAVNTNGDVFVTGESDNDASPNINYDYQTVAYNSSGSQLWQNRYEGVASNDDLPADIAVDGNQVYVTGKSDADTSTLTVNNIVTQIFTSSSGALIGNIIFAGIGGADDASNSVFTNAGGFVIAGYEENSIAQRDALLLQYNVSGTSVWKTNFNGIGDNNENVRGLVVDGSNNVFAVGYSVHNSNDRDFTMVKFSNSGTYICDYSKNGNSTGSEDDAQEVGMDNSGNIICAGFVKDKGSSNDLYYCKINAATCDTIWTRKVDGSGHGSDRIYAMTKDASGNFYLTGRVDSDPSSAANDDCFVAKIDDAGTTIWTQYYNSASTNEDRGTEIAVATNGNVYISGRFWNGSNYDIFLQKYSNAGLIQWTQNYDGGLGDDEPHDMIIDNAENIYITGQSEEITDSVFDFITLKYSSSGAQLWNKKYNGVGNGNDIGEAITTDNLGNVYVIGFSNQSTTSTSNNDMLTIKYNASGSEVWKLTKNGSASSDDAGDDIAMLNDTTIIVTGHINNGTALIPNYDCYSAMYDSSGAISWSDTYNSTNDSSDVPNLIYLKGDDLYIAGSTVITGQMRNMMVIKYSGLTLGTHDIYNNNNVKVYPNPFNDLISFDNSIGANAIEITDITGKTILHRAIKNGINHIPIYTLSSGVYLIQILRNSTILNTQKITHN